MSSRQTCRWAALSLSSISTLFLPDLLGPECEGASKFRHELVAVSTTGGSKKAEKYFIDNKIPNASNVKVFDAWERMLEEGGFDVVYISTPHPLHYQNIIKAIECKRNVLVEKPATMNAAQYARCTELAKRHRVVLMEAMWTRYLPATRCFVEDILPQMGEIKRVYSDFSLPIVHPDMSHDSRFLDKGAGAGSLLDQGVYPMTWVDLAFNGDRNGNDSAEVRYAVSTSVPNVEGHVDDINTIVLQQQNATAIVTTSMTLYGSNEISFMDRLKAPKLGPAVRIEGTMASVAIAFPPIRPTELSVQWYAPGNLNKDGTAREEIIRRPITGYGLWYQAEVIAEAVLRGEKGLALGEAQSLRVLRWVDEARKMAGVEYDPKMDVV